MKKFIITDNLKNTLYLIAIVISISASGFTILHYLNHPSELTIVNSGSGSMKGLSVSSSCSGSYPIDCGDGNCGSSKGWCDNHKSGGNHCEISNPNWCCLDSGYVICNQTSGMCGSSQSYCDNLKNNPQQGNCNVGYVQDYIKNLCCPSTAPFLHNGNSCIPVPALDSNNWYTQQSNCIGFESISGGIDYWANQQNYNQGILSGNGNGIYSQALKEVTNNFMNYSYCDGTDLVACKDDISPSGTNPYNGGNVVNSGIYHYRDMGKIIGICGVQCLTDADCGVNNQCINNICSQIQQITIYRFQNNSCSQPLLIYPSQRTSNDYNNLTDCQKNIVQPVNYWVFIIVILAITLIICFLIWLYRKSKR